MYLLILIKILRYFSIYLITLIYTIEEPFSSLLYSVYPITKVLLKYLSKFPLLIFLAVLLNN